MSEGNTGAGGITPPAEMTAEWGVSVSMFLSAMDTDEFIETIIKHDSIRGLRRWYAYLCEHRREEFVMFHIKRRMGLL